MRNTVRTFVAIEIPAEVRQRARQLIERLRPTSAHVRWVESEQLHWTLKFLGEVELVDIPQVCERVTQAAAQFAPFDVESWGAGAFPDADHARTVWLGVRHGGEAMIALHDAIAIELAKLGYRQEQRRFRPHVTLGRVRRDEGLAELGQLIRQNADFDGGLSTVFEVAVFSSELGPKGPTFAALGHSELTADDSEE